MLLGLDALDAVALAAAQVSLASPAASRWPPPRGRCRPRWLAPALFPLSPA